VPLLDDLTWAMSQPDNKAGEDDCLHMKLVDNSGIAISDRNCSDKYVIACEVKSAKFYVFNI